MDTYVEGLDGIAGVRWADPTEAEHAAACDSERAARYAAEDEADRAAGPAAVEARRERRSYAASMAAALAHE